MQNHRQLPVAFLFVYGEHQYRQNHTHSPAQQQFNEIDQTFFFLFLLAVEHLVDGADELVIKQIGRAHV